MNPEKKEPGGTFHITKTEPDKMLVFGWGNVAIRKDGTQVSDLQGDEIDAEELEKAAYDHVLNFRNTGERHDPGLRQKGRLVESCVFTKEKQAAIGIPPGIVPEGWWVGYKIDDPVAWEKIKKGDYQMFSIEGKGKRVPVKKSALKGCGVLVVKDGKILCGTRIERGGRGTICGPGGHIEAGETPEEAAKREAREEFGISCEKLSALGTLESGTSAVFLCTKFSGTPKTDEKEMTDPKWRTIEELQKEDLFGAFEQSLELLKMSPEKRHGVAKSYEEMRKFNPYHDRLGRFSNGRDFVMFRPGKDPNQAQRAIDRENAKRKAEGVAGEVNGAFDNVGIYNNGSAPLSYANAKQRARFKQQQAEEERKKKEAEEARKKVETPDKPGKSIKWDQMTDDEFVQNLDKYMPGMDTVLDGYAKGRDAHQFVDKAAKGDMVLSDIYAKRGYDALPQMMDKADIKQYIAQNGTPELYRGARTSRTTGQSGEDKMNQFTTGDFHYAGLGVLGNGTYAAQTPVNSARNYGLRVARSYSGRSPNASLRMTLQKDTRTAAYQTVRRQQRDFNSKLRDAIWNGKIDRAKGNAILDITMNVGRFAALRGYEAYYDKSAANSGARPEHPFWVVLNRGKLIVQNERYT